jgi:uncharacterized protein YaeQ
MALRATIYKAEVSVADTDRHYYASHTMTIARHPSETDLRMMVRMLAFALNADEALSFTKGLSDIDEPDVWLKDLTGSIELWIEVGQPEERRILRACGRADKVMVYCYGGHASQIWWNSVRGKLEKARNLQIINLPQDAVNAMALLARRSMSLNYTIQDGVAHVSSESGEVSVEPAVWK